MPTYLPAVRYGGPIGTVHGLCRALSGRGHTVSVATTGVDGPNQIFHAAEVVKDVDGVEVHYFRSRALRRLYWSPPMGRFLAQRTEDFDVVHIHAVFLWPGWAAARQARRSDIPHVISPRGMLVPDLIRRKSRIKKSISIACFDRRAVENASLIHFTSTREQQRLRGTWASNQE